MDSTVQPVNEIKECYEIISQAREFHQINMKRKVSEKTKLSYNRIAERLIFKYRVLPIDSTLNKNSYFVYKAAVASYVMDAISRTLPEMDALRISNSMAWHDEIVNLQQYLDFLSVIGVDQDKRNLIEYKNGNYHSSWSNKKKPCLKKNNKSRLYMGFGVFLTKTANNEDSKPLPRFLTLWTNSKKLRYSGNLACDRPRCGRSQERNSDQKPSIVFE